MKKFVSMKHWNMQKLVSIIDEISEIDETNKIGLVKKLLEAFGENKLIEFSIPDNIAFSDGQFYKFFGVPMNGVNVTMSDFNIGKDKKCVEKGWSVKTSTAQAVFTSDYKLCDLSLKGNVLDENGAFTGVMKTLLEEEEKGLDKGKTEFVPLIQKVELDMLKLQNEILIRNEEIDRQKEGQLGD
ncbi:MAG TPA: hypothetical protein DCP90_08530 [Clostridiales bacterium]|nr:MAG: hypothetical protein A2Y22_05895 [Clostridiales bacterium GWD2_32_59]HAN10639.1 hypothetical protein [Clostridiales bacterium]